MFFREILDLGYDYGATGGPLWDDEIATSIAKKELRFPIGELPRRRYELGNRQVLQAEHDYLLNFHAAMRGRVHTFLYKDWGDWRANQAPLTLDGTTATQLTKIYGAGINPYVRTIQYVDPAELVLELDTGGGFVVQEQGVAYTVDQDTGIVTWAVAPNELDDARWTGPFFVPVRFDVQQFPSQFLVIDEEDDEAGYAIGSLPLIEDLGAL